MSDSFEGGYAADSCLHCARDEYGIDSDRVVCSQIVAKHMGWLDKNDTHHGIEEQWA